MAAGSSRRKRSGPRAESKESASDRPSPPSTPTAPPRSGSSPGPGRATPIPPEGARAAGSIREGLARLVRARAFAPALVAFAAFALFAPALGFDFAYDDLPMIRDNPRIRNLGDPSAYLATSYWDRPGQNREYRPWVLASYALDHALAGPNPRWFHFGTLFLHVATCLALWELTRALFGRRGLATAAALLFAVHPIHVEAVAGVVGRAESMSALGFLLALRFALHALRAPSPFGPILGTAGATLAAAFAVGSKENSLALGPALLALVWIEARIRAGAESDPAGKSGMAVLAPSAPIARAAGPLAGVGLVSIAYLAARVAVLGGLRGDPLDPPVSVFDNPLVELAPLPRALTALELLGRQALSLFWPFHPSPDYSYGAFRVVARMSDPRWLLGAGLLPVAIALGALLRRRPAILFGGALFLVSFLLTSNLFFPIGTIMGERLLYLPSAGFCIALADAAALFAERARAARAAGSRSAGALLGTGVAVVAIWSVACVARTATYLPAWRNNSTLFAYMVEAVPGSARAHMTRGADLLTAGDVEGAIRHLERSVEIMGRLPASRAHLGAAYVKAGRIDDAERVLREALRADPYEPIAVMNYARVLVARGDRAGAEALYLPALERHSRHQALRLDRALLLEENGRAMRDPERLREATRALGAMRRERGLERDPHLLGALGRAHAMLGEREPALEALRAALEAKPGDPDLTRALERVEGTAAGGNGGGGR